MIYDSIIDLFRLLFGTIEFLKPYATTVGVLFLILRQNNIRKMINGQLPRRFRDTHESDMQEMRQDIKEVMYDVKLLKQHGGVTGEWTSNLQLNGSKITQTPISIIFYTFLQGLNIRRRLTKMSKWTSRKFLMAILAAVLPIINEQFNLGLDTNVVIAAIGGIVAFILGESHIDAKRAGGSIDAIPPINTESNK